MRPEQKIILSCRQTGERAERLQEWLEQSRLMLKSQCRALRTEVQVISSELGRIIEAVEQAPTAGILGGWGSARAELIGTLLTERHGGAPEDETRLALGRGRILTLMPRDAEGGQAASLRLVSSARTESPFRFPIRMSLLSQLDLVKIIASAYLLHVPPRQRKALQPDAIARQLTMNANELGTQSFSGMARREIDSVRDALHALAPESVALRALDAAGYWDTLGELIPHLPDAARRRAFAPLWGADPTLCALFERLSDAIELLGFSGEAFAGVDAFVGRHPVTGWIVRHEDSVLAAATILHCHNTPERTVRVSSRHGRATDVERFVIAALASEVRLPVDAAALALLETADVLVLPAPSPVLLWPQSGGGLQRRVPEAQPLTTAEALHIFAASKASYLADLAVMRHEMTSLLVLADLADSTKQTGIDAASSATVANWIELTQGETAHARERRRTGLSILVADNASSRYHVRDSVFAPQETAPAIGDTVTAVFDEHIEWATEWTPNRPFRNVFKWRPNPAMDGVNAASDAASGGSADILRFSRARPDEPAGGAPADELASANDLGALLHTVTQSTTSAAHIQHLSARLIELRRNLSARFLRLHISNDPIGIVEWRRQVCHVAQNRLERCATLGEFGRLQRALLFSEAEARAVLARLKSDDPRCLGGLIVDLRTIEPQRIVDGGLQAWITAMRQATRAPSLMRALHVPGAVVGHLIDELALGAVRIGLQEKLSEAVRRIQQNAASAVSCEQAIAALLERGINAYVETLDPSARSTRTAGARDTRFGMGVAAVTAASAPQRMSIAVTWAEAFADLVEANILGASLLGGAGHLNRELGEVLSAVSAQSYEGLS
jgi:hypothetical protein